MFQVRRALQEIQLPGGWQETSFSLGGRAVSLLLPSAPDALLDHLDTLAANLGHADPYWARLWPTAITMAEWVVRRPWLAGQRALELGCGVGLVGIAGLVAGLQVTFSDYVALAVAVASENARRNGFPDAATCVFDWQHSPSDRFPLILGSDVLYDPQQHESLCDLLDCMLLPGGVCWLGDPGRYHVPAFVRRSRERGYETTLFAADGREQSEPAAGQFQMLKLRIQPAAGRQAAPKM